MTWWFTISELSSSVIFSWEPVFLNKSGRLTLWSLPFLYLDDLLLLTFILSSPEFVLKLWVRFRPELKESPFKSNYLLKTLVGSLGLEYKMTSKDLMASFTLIKESFLLNLTLSFIVTGSDFGECFNSIVRF